MKFKTFVLALCLLPSCSPAAEDIITRPVKPEELLKCLPPAQAEWRLTASNAEHTKQNPPRTKAVREYTKIENPAETVPAVPVTPTIAKLTLFDTCGQTEWKELYAEPKSPSTAEDGNERKFIKINGIPGARVRIPGQPDVLELFLVDRFMMKMELPPEEKAEEWLKKIDLKVLKAVGDASGTINQTFSYVFHFERVDELNPQRNRSIRGDIAGTRPDRENE